MTDEVLYEEKIKQLAKSAEAESLNIVQNTIGNFLKAASVEAVYGQPVKKGDTLIIPTAEVLAVMGFGVGSGYGKGVQEAQEAQGGTEGSGEGGGGGGGGGGRILSRPAAVIIATPDGVRIEPVVDKTKIALAALTAAGFMIGMLLRMLNPRKGFSE